MKREWICIWTVLLLLLANSCQSDSTPTMVPTASPPPSDTLASRQQAGVVLVAMDGARPDWLAGYMQDGTIPNLAALAKRGPMRSPTDNAVLCSGISRVEPSGNSMRILPMNTPEVGMSHRRRVVAASRNRAG